MTENLKNRIAVLLLLIFVFILTILILDNPMLVILVFVILVVLSRKHRSKAVAISLMTDDSPKPMVVSTSGGVEALRGCEVGGGQFHYKVKVKNDTDYVINNVTVNLLAYPNDCI